MLKHCHGSARAPSLKVDFSLSTFTAVISEANDPQSKPIYNVDIAVSKPQLVFTSAADGSSFASTRLNSLHVNAVCDIRGQPISFRAVKRFAADYTYPSRAFSSAETPALMTWTRSSDFTVRDWVCLDEQRRPVAQFSANNWSVMKLGHIDFIGSISFSDAAREEIVVTALTLYYCMRLRSTSLYGFCAAIFFQPAQSADANNPATADRDRRQIAIQEEKD